ncbi:MAG: bifunctional UDP-N-acetylglucosamine diphosphorylase/glucosamine-1-phosphate N-acetyltransferase GlmU [Gammaproteobacteria bacterium]|nr:bifunctional UDP-N-acetylglucosamine diphosphorylase/glucosamine-1-phosphate N-acetyltransferase GlmU [Gammaproteobacteria bacterium]
MSIKVVVLAAGKGTRMKSSKPKVLHRLAGLPLLKHVLNNVAGLNPEAVITVIGHEAGQVVEEIGEACDFVSQEQQKGTGHAVQQATALLADDDRVLIAYGDVPLTRPETFQQLLALCSETTIGLLSVTLENPTGYGRIVRDSAARVVGIVEEKDASDDQRKIREVNTGMLSINGAILKRLLDRIDNNNAQGEYYLTDIFALAEADGLRIETVSPEFEWEVTGVNSRQQLAELERIHQANLADELMQNGVTLVDPARIDICGHLSTGNDVEIHVNCVFNGDVELGDNVVVGPNCVISDSRIGSGTVIQANSVIEKADIGEHNAIGPFARIRPGSKLEANAHIGNFVEIKNSHIDQGSKVNHLSYVGDADIGKNTNVGAGTITCNYDGANKHRTVMGDSVFIGSNSALVAPVRIGDGATIGAGSVISRDVDANQLALTRAAQKSINGWQRPQKKPK